MRKEANKLRSNDIFFMPLGGGQRVGASCYFLRLGDTNILLDAGIGGDGKTKFLPDEYLCRAWGRFIRFTFLMRIWIM